MKLKRVVIKEELVELTGDYIGALVLNQFIYWSERTKDFNKFIEAEKQRDAGLSVDFTNGWIYKTSEELSEELMLGLSISTMRRHLSKVVQSGYLLERNNPKYAWDRTLQYRPNMVKIQTDLHKLGYSLEGYPLVLSNAIFKMKNGSSEMKKRTSQNETAIPETTTKTTTESIYTPSNSKPKNGKLPPPDYDTGEDLETQAAKVRPFIKEYEENWGELKTAEWKKVSVLARQPGADLEKWKSAVMAMTASKVRTVDRAIEIYNAGGTWQSLIDKWNKETEQTEQQKTKVVY